MMSWIFYGVIRLLLIMVTISPQQAAAANCAYWVILNQIKLANGNTFSFEDREYQREPMESRHPRICYMKATGGGFSEIEIIKTLHGMIHRRYPQGVLYMFPTNDDVQDFSKSRFNPLILFNYNAIGRHVKTVGKGVDSAKLKRVGGSNLYLRGARLDPSDTGGDAKKSTKLTGIQVDRIVPDEIDQMDSEAIAKARGRMGSAACDGIKGSREEAYIANPSDEDRGIDLYWQESDKRQWFRVCQECSAETSAELEFQNNPEKSIGIDDNGKGFIKCRKCGRPLKIYPGRWTPQAPTLTENLLGYHWSHLTSAYHDPYKVLQRFNNPPEGNLGDVYRLDLGLPYSAREDKLRKRDVLACCGRMIMPMTHVGQCAMGVDNDDGKHVVILIRTGVETFEIIKVARVENFGKVLELDRRYNVKSRIVDLRPNADSAREYAKEAPGTTFLCEYTESPLIDAHYIEETGIVKIYRTGAFDKTHKVFSNLKIVLPGQCAEIDEFAQQLCNCVKSKEVDKKTNRIVYRYKLTGTKQNHYRNALNYGLFAAMGGKISISGRTKNRQTQADNNYTRV